MQYITGTNRHQTIFTTLEEQVSADNTVRLIDAFVNKLDLPKLGFATLESKSEGRPGYPPQVLLKLYLYGYLNKIRSSRPAQGGRKRMQQEHRVAMVIATACAQLSQHSRL